MKELREARKVNKQGKHLEAEKIKAELEAAMGEHLHTFTIFTCNTVLKGSLHC